MESADDESVATAIVEEVEVVDVPLDDELVVELVAEEENSFPQEDTA